MAFEKEKKQTNRKENTFLQKLRPVPAYPRSPSARGGREACGRRRAAASALASGRWAAPEVDLDWGCERARGGKRRRLERRGRRTGKSICKERRAARARAWEGRKRRRRGAQNVSRGRRFREFRFVDLASRGAGAAVDRVGARGSILWKMAKQLTCKAH